VDCLQRPGFFISDEGVVGLRQVLLQEAHHALLKRQRGKVLHHRDTSVLHATGNVQFDPSLGTDRP
jgi:hypothetical protein